MKEKTRKTVVIGLLWVYLGVIVLNFLLQYTYVGDLYSEGYPWKYLQIRFAIIPLLIRIGLLMGSVFLLSRLLNKVTRCFFYRLVLGLTVLPFIDSFVLFFRIPMEDKSIISCVIALFAVIILMSGAGIFSRNYTLNAYTWSKLRLFQTGVILSFGTWCFTAFIEWVASWFGGMQMPSLLTSIINWIGIICIFWGLTGIIKSDLVSESRKEEVFDRPDGGWLSRPVIGAVCFLGFLSCFVFWVPDICRLLNIELW